MRHYLQPARDSHRAEACTGCSPIALQWVNTPVVWSAAMGIPLAPGLTARGCRAEKFLPARKVRLSGLEMDGHLNCSDISQSHRQLWVVIGGARATPLFLPVGRSAQCSPSTMNSDLPLTGIKQWAPLVPTNKYAIRSPLDVASYPTIQTTMKALLSESAPEPGPARYGQI